jgi:hypothetical protein
MMAQIVLNWLNPEVMDPVVKVVSNESRVSVCWERPSGR